MLKKGISGSTLKMIAIITMLIDHVGAVILARLMIVNGINDLDAANETQVMEWLNGNAVLYGVYTVMRIIGRIAFPIFCFLLVQGIEHTSDCKKYALRLGAFALLSEIPFDLAISGTVLEFGYQNVYFTLLIGLLTMMVYRSIENQEQWSRWVRFGLGILVMLCGMAAAQLLQTDYGALGVFAIMIFYMFRKNKQHQLLLGGAVFLTSETWAVAALIPIALYNGKKGWNLKYAFYLFYPLHLLLLYLICCAMGIGGIATI
ncbi:MAG: conjugal transfer protein TraX [Roseburia sp.]|nr:conjugal transfer protein TraX [Roseburia sp.]